MHDKKYQIFISSTFADLKDERQAAMNSVIDLRHIPIGMEGFPAIDEEQMSYIKRLIDECDYYLLLIANRYGSISPRGTSFTEEEYEYAVSRGKHVLAFINNAGAPSECDAPQSLSAFKQKVSTGRIVKHWTNQGSLELAVFRSLSEAFELDPRVGWVRGDVAIDPKVYVELESARERIKELETLIQSTTPPEDVAGLNHELVIPYSFKEYLQGKGYPKGNSMKKTLGDVFLAIGHEFRTWKAAGALAAALKSGLGIGFRDFSIPDTVSVQILNQFELLKLMRSAVMQSTGGTSYVYYQLTSAGEATLKQSLAIRSS